MNPIGTRGSTPSFLGGASPGIGLVLIGALLAIWTPSDDGVALCPIRLCTGVSCPGCGLTRATSRLLRGDLGGALKYHPLVLLVVAELVVAVIIWQRAHAGLVRIDTRLLNVVLVANGVLLIAVWVVRAVHGSLPT